MVEQRKLSILHLARALNYAGSRPKWYGGINKSSWVYPETLSERVDAPRKDA